jgi:hypothetical protein
MNAATVGADYVGILGAKADVAINSGYKINFLPNSSKIAYGGTGSQFQAVYRNGVLIPYNGVDGYNIAPINEWFVLTVILPVTKTEDATVGNNHDAYDRTLGGRIAELRTFPSVPTDAQLNAVHADITSYTGISIAAL